MYKRLLSLLLLIAAGVGSAKAAQNPSRRFLAPPPLPPPNRSGFAPVHGARLWYAEYGSGAPVILLHGAMRNARLWAFQILALQRRYHVIVLNNRGHGRSTLGNEPLTYNVMGGDLVALMNYLHFRKAALIGWSDGGSSR